MKYENVASTTTRAVHGRGVRNSEVADATRPSSSNVSVKFSRRKRIKFVIDPPYERADRFSSRALPTRLYAQTV
jgi:hypothetical protein